MKRDIVAGPLSSLGINNNSIYATQGIKHIAALMNLGKIKCITGKHHRDSTKELKIKMGCELSLFTKNFPLF